MHPLDESSPGCKRIASGFLATGNWKKRDTEVDNDVLAMLLEAQDLDLKGSCKVVGTTL